MSDGLPFSVTVEIVGFTGPTTFASLFDALDVLRAGLALLPLDADQADCLADQFGPRAAGRIAHRLYRFGAVGAVAFVGLDPHPIYVCRAASPPPAGAEAS
ncbi:hypothetical protein ACFQ6N_19220 [Kitasatospora sp. NPDC056446]|uniref:hypothetical protein n=1 Tax=Kitasatospora sp. NPDC056446 TaxID=3345819 RepID=UPI003693F669